MGECNIILAYFNCPDNQERLSIVTAPLAFVNSNEYVIKIYITENVEKN